jgi:hypothetical protein
VAAASRDDAGRRVRFCDELEVGLGWISPAPARLERAAHALADAGRVWLFDALDGDGVEGRVHALGEPAAVVQLLDRHDRDCAALAARFGVPHVRPPFADLPGTPFEVVPIARRRLWWEVAIWWPERAVLVCGDALGTAPYYRGPGERLAVHPFLRLTPPRRLRGLSPRHILVGHGEGIHGDEAVPALERALASSRRGAGRWAVRVVKEET